MSGSRQRLQRTLRERNSLGKLREEEDGEKSQRQNEVFDIFSSLFCQCVIVFIKESNFAENNLVAEFR